MLPSTLSLYLFSLLQLTHGYSLPGIGGLVRRVPVVKRSSRNVPSEGFHNPYDNGGHLLTVSAVTFEPSLLSLRFATDWDVYSDRLYPSRIRMARESQ